MSTVSSHPTPPPGFQMIILSLQQNLKNLDWGMQKNNWKVCVLFITELLLFIMINKTASNINSYCLFFLQHCCPPAKWLLKNQRMYLWSWKNQLNNLIRAMFHKLHTQFIFQISHKQFYWINYFMLNWKYFNFIWWPLNRWPFDVEQSVMYFIRRAWLVCKVKDSGFTTEVIF